MKTKWTCLLCGFSTYTEHPEEADPLPILRKAHAQLCPWCKTGAALVYDLTQPPVQPVQPVQPLRIPVASPDTTLPMLEVHITDIKQFRSCRVRWDFSSPLRQNLEPKSPNKHLWLGSGVHYALAAYYGSPNRTGLVEAWEQWVIRERERLAQEVLSDEQKEEIEDYASLGRVMLQHYLLWAPTADDFEVIMPEVKINIPLPFPNTYYVGTCDGLVRRRDGKVFMLEHKTAVRFPDFSLVTLDSQSAAYLWATRQDERFADFPPDGLMFNFLRKKKPFIPQLTSRGELTKRMNIDTTLEVYQAAIRSVGHTENMYGGILQHLRAKGNDFFKRVPVQFGPGRLRQLEDDLLGTVADMLDPDVRIYPNDNWQMFTCKNCPYRRPCNLLVNGTDPTPILEADYRRRVSAYELGEADNGD